MSWSYEPTQFNSTTSGAYSGSTVGVRYQVRLIIQDTNTSRQLLQDEEIDWFQTVEPNVYTAAAACCESLVIRAGGVRSKKISEFQIVYDPGFYQTLAMQLRGRGASYQIPYAGGISISDKIAQQDDSDWVSPAIPRNLDDDPGAPRPATPSSNPLTTI